MKDSARNKSHWTREFKFVAGGLFFLVLLVECFFGISFAASSLDANRALPKLLTITWEKGPDLPQGFQDSTGGIAHHRLITVGGFCSGQQGFGVVNKAGKYPRGFLKKAWALNLKEPQTGWSTLPEFPGAPRQMLFSAIVQNQLYVWGGYSYSRPYCYKDGYRLSKERGEWRWNRLPDLPWPVADAGTVVIGSKIYLMGGTDADYGVVRDFTNSDRHGKIKRLGARLLVFDTNNPGAGWKELTSCPGTPRFNHAVAVVHGMIYVIGGATGNDNPSGNYATVVDNWRYNPATDKWSRLADTPIDSGNFPSGSIVFDSRYIVLVGGDQYKNVLDPEGVLRKSQGKVFRHYENNPYDSDVFVFDTQTNKFGLADPLPLNNSCPMVVLQGDKLYLIGGETGGSVIQGEYFGHHPDLLLIGTIRLNRTRMD